MSGKDKGKEDKSGDKRKKYSDALLRKKDISMKKFRSLGVTEEEAEEYLVAFSNFDRNGDGVISANELEAVFVLLNQQVSQNDIKEMMKKADKDGNGVIDFGEFVEMMHSHRKSLTSNDQTARLKQVFDFFDIDKNGRITQTELKETMAKIGQPVTDDEAKEMIKIADKNNDGEINFEEFIELMKQVKPTDNHSHKKK